MCSSASRRIGKPGAPPCCPSVRGRPPTTTRLISWRITMARRTRCQRSSVDQRRKRSGDTARSCRVGKGAGTALLHIKDHRTPCPRGHGSKVVRQERVGTAYEMFVTWKGRASAFAHPTTCYFREKYLRSGGAWPLRVGISKPSPLSM